ncbi:hypothetical protein BDY17DRAFT_302238 [Neohortaea acidophila]|uniref:DH domain-containing protein n=1 Tax=Neohortaea acidophila TaxID=245834 RepID=A0A6A6PLW6_9PEZI|nr:uncharacterized protein BDY17DRAFT_302238 [Neohortaea acidophila]KAF2480691.1 hypothetical protein BDY17DRAFT_302238 [Neohortaea acidophila]
MSGNGPSSTWGGDNDSLRSTTSSPPLMSATSGPISAHEYFYPTGDTPLASPTAASSQSTSQLPTSDAHSHLPSTTPQYPLPLSNAKSTPVLVPSGSVKNIASQFDQAGHFVRGGPYAPLTLRSVPDKYRRPGVSKNSAHVSPRSPTKSPTKDGPRKLQKSRVGHPRSPVKSPLTSFETLSSFGSTTSFTTANDAPRMVSSPKKTQDTPESAGYLTSAPLFGEITSDGRWNGNFDIGSYGYLPAFTESHRRSSEGTTAFGRGRSQSHQDILQPAPATALPAPGHHNLTHKRSRSEMDALPDNRQQRVLGSYPTPPSSGTRYATSSSSRIPISSRRVSRDPPAFSGTHSRSVPALPNSSPTRRRLSKSPTRKLPTTGKENNLTSDLPRPHYQAPSLPTAASGQSLSAKIVAPLPKLSPPLRSSRPRQPVSQASTSASRARAGEYFPGPAVMRDSRTPSEQWLGKPYDAHQERSRRKIPELEKINFEERRARIQKAISQNLEGSRSLESLRAKSRSRQASKDQAETGAQSGAQDDGPELNKTESVPGGWPTPGGLTVDTLSAALRPVHEPEPMTASTERTTGTEFEVEDSPVLGIPVDTDQHTLLTSAVYQPPSAKPTDLNTTLSPPDDHADSLPSPSVLDNVLRMRERSTSRTSQSDGDGGDADHSAPPSSEDNPSDLEDRWGLGQGLQSVAGSIKIMLDEPWAFHNQDRAREIPSHSPDVQEYERTAFAHQQDGASPIDDQDHGDVEDDQYETPRKPRPRRDTMRASDLQSAAHNVDEPDGSEGDIARLLRHYKSTGTITAEMVEHVQKHMVDLQRVSANEGSNGFMIQNLLDSVLNSQQEHQPGREMQEVHTPQPSPFDIPAVTPDTPVGWEFFQDSGTALVYTSSSHDEGDAETGDETGDEFHVKVRKADAAWERRQRSQYLQLNGADSPERPEPPPKDIGYTPRSSVGADSETLPHDFARGLRISTTGNLDLAGLGLMEDHAQPSQPPLSSSVPPKPAFAPPPLPPQASASASHLPFALPEVPPIPAAYSERASSEMSPAVRKAVWGQSGSSRPSVDSQRATGAPVLPGSDSVTSFAESMRQSSMDTNGDSQTTLARTTSQSPDQKRLRKRRHVIRELLDTENTYHQDLKIIEDIYRATAVPDVLSAEDKKTLFSNCDDVERFSLHFYDELRKAAAPVYVPLKKGWANKHGTSPTTQNDGRGHASDGIDNDKDRASTIGQAFLRNLADMEQVYSVYLKNHDAANRRLAALRNAPAVKCWLDECHNNASDITSAWDLDSLLVKPTQRAAKYPMLLQLLLDTTPPGHPDREALKTAAQDSISMLTRINDAKKRADLVDQIVNRKRKESDVRSGIAKAFGRRTEKLKERVGIAEAYQDTEFDELAHKFGGHFIRLQICMRDVQDYMNRIQKAVDQMNNYAHALDFFADVAISPVPELDSKWRKYGQTIRELTSVAFSEHKAAVNKRVIGPMVMCIKLHEGPQNAINNRKKRIVDYAKCKAIEKRGEKPDKKAIEASDMYEALNDQLKIELPKLYSLTASLVQGCLNCFLDVQVTWYNAWERKLRPILEAADIPSSISQIELCFRPDYDMVKGRLLSLGICNGALLAESANFLSPASTVDDGSSWKRPSTMGSGNRTVSSGGDASPIPSSSASHKRQSSGYVPGLDTLGYPYDDGRARSNSALSNGRPSLQTVDSGMSAKGLWSHGGGDVASQSSRPSTANLPSTQVAPFFPARVSADQPRSPRSPRPFSGATYFTARPEQPEDHRFSNIFSSALPQDIPDSARLSSPKPAPDDTPVLFVCASLFEFSIDKTRREAGYPYLTYVQGEVFDVVAQKGELWLAKNQDDASNTVGWIWEQHFVILSSDRD